MTTSPSRPSRRRSRRITGLIFVLAVLLAVATTVTWTVVTANDDGGKTTLVDGDGFSMSVSDTRISAQAGVAPEGTAVNATSATMDVSDVVWGGVTALRDGVDLTLEGEAQPQQPVQLQFTIPDDVQVPDDGTVFVVASSPGQDKPELLAAQWEPASRTVTAITDHFSLFIPVLANPQKLLEGFGHAVKKMVTSGTDQPTCFGQDPLSGPGEITVSTEDTHAAWPCLELDGDKLVLNLQNNSPLVWEVYSTPEVPSWTPWANSSAAILTASLYPVLQNDQSSGVMLQRESAPLEFDINELPAHVSLDGMPDMMLVGVLAAVADQFMPAGWTTVIGGAECFKGIADSIREDNLEDLSVVTLQCFSLAAGESGGIIIALLTAAPAALYGMVYGAAGEAIDGNSANFDIELKVPATESRLEAGKQYLWDVPHSAQLMTVHPSGEGIDALVVDDGTAQLWASSTSQWIGCDGDEERTRYDLEGDYISLAATPALRAGTPSGLTARIEFEVDGTVVHTSSVTAGTIGEPFDLDLNGAEELVVSATTDEECTVEDLAYGALRATVIEVDTASGIDIAALVGTWSGRVTQGEDTYDLEVQLTETDGAMEGTANYADIKCRGTWSEQGRENGAVIMRETITEDLDDRCLQDVRVVLDPGTEAIDVTLDIVLGNDAKARITRR